MYQRSLLPVYSTALIAIFVSNALTLYSFGPRELLSISQRVTHSIKFQQALYMVLILLTQLSVLISRVSVLISGAFNLYMVLILLTQFSVLVSRVLTVLISRVFNASAARWVLLPKVLLPLPLDLKLISRASHFKSLRCSFQESSMRPPRVGCYCLTP